MKKLLLSLMLASSFAYAGSGVEYEIGSENGHSAPNWNGPAVTNNWFAITPWTEWGQGWDAGLKFEGARDNTPGASLENKIEARIRKSYELGSGFGAGFRVGVGEDFNQQGPVTGSQQGDFAYYLVEPRLTYEATPNLTPGISYRYRNAVSSGHYFQTNTAKIGADYKVTEKDEVGVRYDKKYGGDQHSNGFEVTYSRSF
jgi:hypothetical protein